MKEEASRISESEDKLKDLVNETVTLATQKKNIKMFLPTDKDRLKVRLSEKETEKLRYENI